MVKYSTHDSYLMLISRYHHCSATLTVRYSDHKLYCSMQYRAPNREVSKVLYFTLLVTTDNLTWTAEKQVVLNVIIS